MNSVANEKDGGPLGAGTAPKRQSEDSDAEPPRKKVETRWDTKVRTELHDAVRRNDVSAVLAICAKKRNLINSQDSKGMIPLHEAVRRQFRKIVRILLAAGSNSLVQDRWGMTPLHLACSAFLSNLDIIEDICDHDGVNSLKDKNRLTPLHYAIICRLPIVKKLLLCDLHPKMMDNTRTSSLKLALMVRYEDAVKMIVSSLCLSEIEIEWDDDRYEIMYGELVAACKAEIERMKEKKLPGSVVSYHDVLTRHVSKVAMYLENHNLCRMLLDLNGTQCFPMYAEKIAFKLRKAERWRILKDQCLEWLTVLFGNSLPLPRLIVNSIFVYLNEQHMRGFLGDFNCNDLPAATQS